VPPSGLSSFYSGSCQVPATAASDRPAPAARRSPAARASSRQLLTRARPLTVPRARGSTFHTTGRLWTHAGLATNLQHGPCQPLGRPEKHQIRAVCALILATRLEDPFLAQVSARSRGRWSLVATRAGYARRERPARLNHDFCNDRAPHFNGTRAGPAGESASARLRRSGPKARLGEHQRERGGGMGGAMRRRRGAFAAGVISAP